MGFSMDVAMGHYCEDVEAQLCESRSFHGKRFSWDGTKTRAMKGICYENCMIAFRFYHTI